MKAGPIARAVMSDVRFFLVFGDTNLPGGGPACIAVHEMACDAGYGDTEAWSIADRAGAAVNL